jgi:hypothetical protein
MKRRFLYDRAGQLQPTGGTQFVNDSPEGHTCVEKYGRWSIELTRKPLFTNNKLLYK